MHSRREDVRRKRRKCSNDGKGANQGGGGPGISLLTSQLAMLALRLLAFPRDLEAGPGIGFILMPPGTAMSCSTSIALGRSLITCIQVVNNLRIDKIDKQRDHDDMWGLSIDKNDDYSGGSGGDDDDGGGAAADNCGRNDEDDNGNEGEMKRIKPWTRSTHTTESCKQITAVVRGTGDLVGDMKVCAGGSGMRGDGAGNLSEGTRRQRRKVRKGKTRRRRWASSRGRAGGGDA
eukprot:757828-Hanusia_phi.AAC.5